MQINNQTLKAITGKTVSTAVVVEGQLILIFTDDAYLVFPNGKVVAGEKNTTIKLELTDAEKEAMWEALEEYRKEVLRGLSRQYVIKSILSNHYLDKDGYFVAKNMWEAKEFTKDEAVKYIRETFDKTRQGFYTIKSVE